MHGLTVLVLRAFLGAAFAVILWRLFFPNTSVVYVAGLTLLLVGLAYVSEYFHNRKTE